MNQSRSFWKFLLCLALVLVVTGSVSPVRADRPIPDGEDAEVHPEGVVVVDDLPANGPPAPDEEKEKPHRAPDSEALNGTKAAYHAGHHPEPSPGPSVLASTRTTSIVAGSGAFVGLRRSESGGWLPPDTQLAVSASYVFEAVNLEGRIWTKTGALLKTFNLNSFFGLSGVNLSDPNAGASAAGPIVDPDVPLEVAAGRARVIVELHVDTHQDPAVIASAQERVLAALPSGHAVVMRRYTNVPLLALDIDAEGLGALSRLGDAVVRVRLDAVRRPQ